MGEVQGAVIEVVSLLFGGDGVEDQLFDLVVGQGRLVGLLDLAADAEPRRRIRLEVHVAGLETKSFSGLESLVGLKWFDGPDMRPTLLRVLTVIVEPVEVRPAVVPAWSAPLQSMAPPAVVRPAFGMTSFR